MIEQTKTVLFVCEHGSAKSTVAAAHFNKLAQERNLNFRATSRGTNPDAEYPANVSANLRSDGLAVEEPIPKNLSREDIANAERIVTFCDLPTEYPEDLPVDDWSDVPPISADYGKSRDEIVSRINQLLDNLSQAKEKN